MQRSTNYRPKKENIKKYRVNREIRSNSVRVIIGRKDSDSQLLDVRDAIKLAEEQGLDLVEVAPNHNPPVCRILDYGKFKFIQSKKAKEAKKSQSKILMKDVRLRMRIGDHDMKAKQKRIRFFITSGFKVRIAVFLVLFSCAPKKHLPVCWRCFFGALFLQRCFFGAYSSFQKLLYIAVFLVLF